MSIPKYLTQIVESKLGEIVTLKQRESELSLMQKISDTNREFRSFSDVLRRPGLNLIAEVKKASPSKGIIRDDFDPVKIATSFEKSGAAALSILTDTPFFMGELPYLAQIREAVHIPLLRKDFIMDPIQILESVLAGADAILLIMAILTPDQAQSLHSFARGLGLSVLVEVHTAEELTSALTISDIELLGINNRNLDTFEVDLETSFTLKSDNASNLVWVSESGYDSLFQLQMAKENGFNAVLIGEGLARHPEIIDFFK